MILRRLLAAASILLACQVGNASPKKSDFWLVTTCAASRLCLVGSTSPGSPVTILPTPTASGCIAKSGDSIQEDREGSGSHRLTLLDRTQKCPGADKIDYAVLNKTTHPFKAVALQRMTDGPAKQMVLKRVRADPMLLNSVRNYCGLARGQSGTVESGPLRIPDTATVYQIPEKQDWFLVQGANHDSDSGPVVFVTGTGLFPFNSACVVLKYFLQIERRLFLASVMTGCECGVRFDRIDQLTSEGPLTVFEDGSFSN